MAKYKGFSFYPFAVRKRHIYGWAFRRDAGGKPIIHTLRIKRIQAITGPGIIIARNPNPSQEGEDNGHADD